MRFSERRLASAVPVLFLAFLTGAACDSPAEPSVEYPCLTPGPDVGKRLPPRAPWTTDDEFAARAREVPGGFGGLFVGVHRGRGEPDKVNFYLQDLSRASEAITALGGTEGRYHALQGEYNFLELKSCYDAMGPVMHVEELISTDIDETMNRIVLDVTEASAEARVRKILEESRVPQEMVLIEVGTRPAEAGLRR